MGEARASVQPGIESLSDHVLQLMRKGTRALDNVRFLRLCRSYGVRPYWNLIHGFPGETADDYERVLEMLPALRFLEPPVSCGRLNLDRFSPYFEEHSRCGFSHVRPLSAYRYVYPFPASALRAIAHSFDFDYAEGVEPPASLARVEEEVRAWQAVREPGELLCTVTPAGVVLTDTRPERTGHRWMLDALDAVLYLACDQVRSRAVLMDLARECAGLSGEAEVGRRLSSFVARRLMVTDGERYVSLALTRRSGD